MKRTRHALVPAAPPALELAGLRGSHVTDTRGRRYIDFLMGWCVGNLGWAPPEITRAMNRRGRPDYAYPGFSYRPWDELASLLVSIAPPGLTRVFRATGGSEAVDIALQAAQVHTGRRAFLSLKGAYHGNTIATLNLGAKIAPPLDARALERIERRLRKRDVAAFIMEPVVMNLGVLVPGKVFLSWLQKLCRRTGTLLIMDEVACGFGRTGTLFASEAFGLRPDLLTLGKAITNGAAGLGATLATAAVAKSMEKKGSFYSTFGWHPLAADAAIATVKHFIRRRRAILANVAAMSDYLRARLPLLPFRRPPALNVAGLAIGIDVGDEAYCARIESKCRSGGLIVGAEGSNLLLMPALTLDRRTADRALAILSRSV